MADDHIKPDPFPDVLNMRQVAAKLGKSVRWLQGHVRAHPCGRMVGAKRVFTSADYAALLNTFPKDEPTKSVWPARRRHMAASVSITGRQVALDELLAQLPKHTPRGTRPPRKPD